MILTHVVARFAVLLALLTIAGAGLMASRADASGSRAPRPAIRVHASDFTQTVCSVVKSKSVGGAAEKLLSSSGGVVGELLGQIVVTAVQENCAWLVKQGIKVLQSILATTRPPSLPAVSSIRAYLNRLSSERVNTMASQLGVSSSYLLGARNQVCSAVNVDQSPADVIAGAFGRARLRHLPAMNAFTRLVVDTCGLSAVDANFISGAVLDVVLANEYQLDRDPPVVEIHRTTAQRVGENKTYLTASFWYFDPANKLRSCEVDLWYMGGWHPQYCGWLFDRVYLRSGLTYAWAFRVTDAVGHVSQWAVTPTGTS
jgi:hypothetical protein